MTRPAYSTIASGQQGWDAIANTWHQGLFDDPFAIALFPDIGDLPDPADFAHCLAVVENEDALYMSDGAAWNEVAGAGGRVEMLYSALASGQTSSASETDLLSYTMPGNTMGDGDCLDIHAFGIVDYPGSGDVNIRFKIGGTTIRDSGIISSDTQWEFKGRLWRRTSGTQAMKYDGIFRAGLTLGTPGVVETLNSLQTFDLTASLTIKVTGQNSSGAGSPAACQAYQMEVKHTRA